MKIACFHILTYLPPWMPKDIYDKEQKIHQNFFYIYVLKELLPKTFS